MIVSPSDGATKAPLSRTARPIFQNLGPGTLYFSTTSSDVATEGLKLPVLAVYELPTSLVEGAGEVWFVAVGDTCDVRILNVG